jgi:ribosome-associated translation inhibitor RaiA
MDPEGIVLPHGSSKIWDNEHLKKEALEEGEFEGREVANDLHLHGSLPPVNNLRKLSKRKRHSNDLEKENKKTLKKQKWENTSAEETIEINHDDPPAQSDDRDSNWRSNYNALSLAMNRLSQEILKYRQKHLSSKLKRTEINSSLTSHAPTSYKDMPVAIPAKDCSGLKTNKLYKQTFEDPKLRKPCQLFNRTHVSRVPEYLPQKKPIPFHEPAQEINASLTSSAPSSYKLIPITIPHPDYSGFKINELCERISKDPRLRKPSHIYNSIDMSKVPDYLPQIVSIPFLETTTEIDASLNSHAPISYKLIPITVPPPDYSGLKIIQVCTQISKDPRLHNPSHLYKSYRCEHSS